MTSTIARQRNSQRGLAHSGGTAWLPALAVMALLAYLAPRVLVGADTMWMVALGSRITESRSVPDGVPFAAADTAGWPNVPALGELLMYAVHSVGPAALATALLLLTATTLLLLAGAAVRVGAHPAAVAIAVALTGIGMLPTFGVVRGQMLSLIPYALLLVLLRAETARPSKRIWLVVPLVAIWGNVHGGVLVGVALTGCYLAFARLRAEPLTAALVGIATVLALLANPALLRTVHYYLGVLSNEAARRGTELWARPDLGSTFDLLMVVVAGALGASALVKGRLRAWELCATLGMGAATAMSARHGMWLLLFLLGPGAMGLSRLASGAARHTSDVDADPTGDVPDQLAPRRGLRLLAPALTLSLAALAAITVAGRSTALAGPVDAVATIRSLAGDRVVLAPEPLAEDLAAAGVTVWASNPIDAFSQQDQAAYLDVWLGNDNGRRAIGASEIVVAAPESRAHRLAISAGCEEVGPAPGYTVLDCRL